MAVTRCVLSHIPEQATRKKNHCSDNRGITQPLMRSELTESISGGNGWDEAERPLSDITASGATVRINTSGSLGFEREEHIVVGEVMRKQRPVSFPNWRNTCWSHGSSSTNDLVVPTVIS